MTKKVREVVGRAFETEMGTRLRGFRRRRDVKTPPGDLVFSWTARDPLTFFVILEVNPKWESFGVSLAWNSKGDEMVRYLAMLPTDEPFEGKLRFALHALWNAKSSSPWPWEVEPVPRLDDPASWAAPPPADSELTKRAELLAIDAVAKVEEYGIPYFKQVLLEHEGSRGR